MLQPDGGKYHVIYSKIESNMDGSQTGAINKQLSQEEAGRKKGERSTNVNTSTE